MPKSHRSETYPESEKHFANVDVLLEPLKKHISSDFEMWFLTWVNPCKGLNKWCLGLNKPLLILILFSHVPIQSGVSRKMFHTSELHCALSHANSHIHLISPDIRTLTTLNPKHVLPCITTKPWFWLVFLPRRVFKRAKRGRTKVHSKPSCTKRSSAETASPSEQKTYPAGKDATS